MISDICFTSFPQLRTKNLTLRKFCKDDLSFMYKLRSDSTITDAAGIEIHKSIDETKVLLEEVNYSYEVKTGISWVIELAGSKTPIGYIGIWKITRDHFKGEIGYSLLSDFQNKGYMTEALNSISNFAFKDLNLHRLEANVISYNTASINLLKKHNFLQEAHLKEDYFYNNRFYDSLIFGKINNEN